MHLPFHSKLARSSPNHKHAVTTLCLCVFFFHHFFVFELLLHLLTIPWLFQGDFCSSFVCPSNFSFHQSSVVWFISFHFFRLHFIVCFISIHICMHSSSSVDLFSLWFFYVYLRPYLYNFIESGNRNDIPYSSIFRKKKYF